MADSNADLLKKWAAILEGVAADMKTDPTFGRSPTVRLRVAGYAGVCRHLAETVREWGESASPSEAHFH